MSITTSTLTLYKNCRITSDKFFKVDSIETYLATLTSSVISSFQYIKHDLEISIKVDKSQTFLAFEDDKGFNYCKIKNSSSNTEKAVYYFIVSQKWLSQDTIQFNLRMDTINTFLDSLTFTDKTKIIREHRDGWAEDSSNRCIPIIDFASEGFNPPLYTDGSKEILQHATYNDDWYLIYKNVNVPEDTTELSNPVECILATTNGMNIGGYTGVVKSANYKTTPPSYQCLTFTYGDNGDRYLYLQYQDSQGNIQPQVPYQLGGVVIHPSNSHRIRLDSISFNTMAGHTGLYVEVILCGTDIDDNNLRVDWVQNPNNDNTNNWVSFDTTSAFGRNLPSYEYILSYPDYLSNDSLLVKWGGGYGAFVLPPLSYYDRTDSRLIKIIKLPYCPTDFINTPANLTNQWRYDYVNYELKLRNTTTKFSYQFNALIRQGTGTTAFTPFEVLHGFSKSNVSLWQSKSLRTDPKIYHSEFYEVKMVYDSFTMDMPLEQIKSTEYNSIYNSFPITFTTSTTINSKFMFEMDNFITDRGSQDFNRALMISRNNELPIFNQAYINYIRSGYNYDKKIKTTRETTAWAGVGLGILGGAVSGAYFGGGVGATAGAIIGAVGSMVNAISQTIQAETSFEAKLNALNWQSTQVSATDDVDLMTQVCGNRLRCFVYTPSVRISNLINSLFYFYGYGGERFGVPNTNTRIHFNFLQCQAVFKEEELNLKTNYIDDIKMKLENGITFLHYTATASSNNEHWDFNQVYANWEASLFE